MIEPGSTLAHYEIISALGKGGMGEVWRARDQKLGREVAIKTLPEEFAKDEERLARFEREAKLLASLNHPNIAGIYGLEEDKGSRFLVLELVEGETLADRIQRGPIPVEESLVLALQTAEALDAAHEKGVIHRDLKPANIKVTPDGQVKVLDFGLAKVLPAREADADVSNSPTLTMAATQEGLILGTAAYMSPEQARGRKVDKRTDIWAFGCVLYEMLTGRQAFQGEDLTEVLASVIKTHADLDLLPAGIHPAATKILKRCLERDVKKRVRDIGDVRFELEQLSSDPDGASLRPVSGEIQTLGHRRLPWVVAFLLSVFVAAVATWSQRPAPEASLLVTRFDYELSGTQQFRNVGQGLTAISPDGRQVAYNTTDGFYLLSLDQGEGRLIPGTEGNIAYPMFSPDGQWLAYWSIGDRQLQKIPVGGGSPRVVADIESQFLYDASWAPDDRILFANAPSRSVMWISGNGGSPQTLFQLGPEVEGFPVAPQMLPDRDSVLFTLAGNDESRIAVLSIESGRHRVLFVGDWARYLSSGHLIYGIGGSVFSVPFESTTTDVAGGVPVLQNVRDVSFSDSGTLAYVTGAPADRILGLADRSGTVELLDLPPNQYLNPRLSPSGDKLAVQTIEEGSSTIWIYDLFAGRAIRRLTQEGENTRPIWSRDGAQVTFASRRGGRWGIYRRSADGSGAAERLAVLEEGDGEPWLGSWSSDGGTLSFTRARGFERSVWTLSPESAGLQLFADAANGFPRGSAISPDGRWLAYFSEEEDGENNNVYVQPFPATGEKYKVSEAGGTFPLWSRDRSELFYRRALSEFDDFPRLIAIDVETEDGFSWGTERPIPIEGFAVFNGYRDYDIMPDGEQFVMIFPAAQGDSSDSGPDRINIVMNWFEELKQRVPVQ